MIGFKACCDVGDPGFFGLFKTPITAFCAVYNAI